jgi:hypothetical protein
MLRAGFEPAIPATKRPQTYALDGAATTIGRTVCQSIKPLKTSGNYMYHLLYQLATLYFVFMGLVWLSL